MAAMRALEALAHERTVARLKQESGDVGYESNEDAFTLSYDPVSIFLLEAMVSITCQTPQYIEDIWYKSSPCPLLLTDEICYTGPLCLSICRHYCPHLLNTAYCSSSAPW